MGHHTFAGEKREEGRGVSGEDRELGRGAV